MAIQLTFDTESHDNLDFLVGMTKKFLNLEQNPLQSSSDKQTTSIWND